MAFWCICANCHFENGDVEEGIKAIIEVFKLNPSLIVLVVLSLIFILFICYCCYKKCKNDPMIEK